MVSATCDRCQRGLVSLGHAHKRTLICVRNKRLVPKKYAPHAKGAIAMQGHYHMTLMDTGKIAETMLLPHRMKDIPFKVLIDHRATPEQQQQFHNYTRVRAWVCRFLLRFLKKYNHLYADVDISEERLTELPQDDNDLDLQERPRTQG